MKILCFGDSNTYGYDPRGFGGRYPDNWVALLAQKTGIETANAGQNGREIPRNGGQLREFRRLLAQESPIDLLLVMLGTNDLLRENPVEAVVQRMEAFLKHIDLERSGILLIGPPPMTPGEWVPGRQLADAAAALTREYKILAKKLDIRFADPGQWNISLAFDGVHFTEEGHRAFAEGLCRYLNEGE